MRTTDAASPTDRIARVSNLRVIVGGQVPPPQSGQHVAVARAVAQLSTDPRLQVEHLPYRFAGTMTDQGRLTVRKVLALLGVVARVLATRRHGPIEVFLHPVSGPATGAAIKDAVVLAAARLVSRHVVLQFHGGGHANAWATANRMQRILTRVLSSADLGVVHASVHRRDPLHLGIDHVAVVPHRIPDRHDRSLRQRDPDDPTVRILYVGHLGPHRGTPDLVQAVAGLHADGLPVALSLVGAPAQGWTLRNLDAVLASVPPELVSHHGEVSGPPLDALFANADVFAFPSVFVAETFGLVLVEALMWGLPVVATDWLAAREVLGGQDLDVILHPTGPILADQVHDALANMVDGVRSGRVPVPSTANRRWYEQAYRDDVCPLADVLVGLTQLSGAGSGRRPPSGNSRPS